MGRCPLPLAARATTGAAYQAPTTNRLMGPKLILAGAPTKCRPGTEDSSPRPSTG